MSHNFMQDKSTCNTYLQMSLFIFPVSSLALVSREVVTDNDKTWPEEIRMESPLMLVP